MRPNRWRSLRGLGLQYLPALLLLAALIALWELAVALLDIRPYLLPAPSRIWIAFLRIDETLPHHTWITMAEATLGLAVAAVVGVALAALIASVGLVRRVLYPLLVASQAVPMIVLAPLLVVWFGFGMAPKVIVVALVGFFPIVVNTIDGLLGADREMVGLVRSMGASRAQVLQHILIPSALPAFLAGLKIAAAYAMVGAIIGEWVGAGSGLGIFITRSQASFRIDQVFVAIVIVALASILLFALVQLAARLATPWMFVHEKEDGG